MNTEMQQSSAGRVLSLGGALKYIGRSAMQLHRYRYLRTRILHDSLERIDGNKTDARVRTR
jgi:hypothetical protein